MIPNELDNLQLFVIKSSILSFIILCEVNILALLVINLYVFDFDAYLQFSFNNCLQSCAQYNQRQTYEEKLNTFAQFCSVVT